MPEQELNLPRDDELSERERMSQNAVRYHFRRGFITRVPDEAPDRGADGSIELRISEQGGPRATGKRAWFQLKHTASPTRLADGSVSCPVDTKNINYLGNHPCPFYLLYILPTDELRFRWWRDVRAELDRERPEWNAQKQVSIRFMRVVDDALLQEIKTELESYALQVARLFDGPGFIRNVTADRARRLLDPDPLFVERGEHIDLIGNRMGRGTVVPVVGAPGSGKSELVRHILTAEKGVARLAERLGQPVALLVVDVGARVEPRLLRGLAYSVGLQKSWESDPDEPTRRGRDRAAVLWEGLPGRAQGQHLVAVIDNADSCLSQPEERGDLDELLASEPFRSGCAVVVSRFGAAPDGNGTRALQAETVVGPLAPASAAALLENLAIESSLAWSVVDEARLLPELLLPGVIRRGAGSFGLRSATGLIASSKDAILNELIDAASQVSTAVLMALGCRGRLLPGEPDDCMASLMAMGVLTRQAVCDADLRRAKLPVPPLIALRQVGWMEYAGSDAYRLTGFGSRSLRAELKRMIEASSDVSGALRAVAEVVQRLIEAIMMRQDEAGFDEFALAIEEAISWTRESGLGGTAVEAILLRTLMPYVVDDVFFPIQEGSAAAVQRDLHDVERPAELADAAAALVLASRSNAPADEFIERLRGAVEVAAATPRFLAIHIRAMDIATSLGEQRHHRLRDILHARRKLVTRLLNLSDTEAADVGVLKWSASWILNTASAAGAVGEAQDARTAAEAAKAAVSRLPLAKTAHGAVDRWWLLSRLAQIESHREVAPAARLAKLREAMDSSFEAFAIAPTGARWGRFALRAAGRVSEELRSDEERDQLLDEVSQRVGGIFGDTVEWPLPVLAQTAALARNVGALSAGPECRLRQVQRGLDLLQPVSGSITTLADHGDTRVLLVLARALAFAATCHDELGEASAASTCRRDALRLCREALDSAPSAAAWEVYLRLVDQQGTGGRQPAWHVDELGGARLETTPELRQGISDARAFLANEPFWNSDHGRLALWCVEREWRGQGSLERWAARQQDPQTPWSELSADKKRRVLGRLHRRRQVALDQVEQRSGPDLELYMARMRNEAQFQRSVAIYGDHNLNTAPVLRHVEAARRLWPDSHALLVGEGHFRRFVWDFPGAIVALRRVVATAPRGSVRRDAAADLAEVLITATASCERVEFDDGTVEEGEDLVVEARALLSELEGFRKTSREFSILRDRADLEAGLQLDWGRIDHAFERVVGNEYATTVIENLAELRAGHQEVAAHVADLVVADFTGTQALRGLGSLYLRRAELGVAPDHVRDCRRAYKAFDACRVLEMAQLGSRKESATTSYQRGRAIMAAAKATRSSMPFDGDCEGKLDLLDLAHALFSRTVSLTVGLFHIEAKRRLSEATRLAQALHT